jgi:cytochrome c oxidase cbb3-type subunit III
MSWHLAFAVSLASLLVACDREEREFTELPESPTRYDDNAFAISRGQKLYNAMNCVGCHSNGGGGMGPPLMDAAWIYGSDPSTIRETIVKGRPNGMPSFEGRLTEQQQWQIVAYVRSLSGLTENMATASRSDHMNVSPNLQLRHEETPVDTATANRRVRR